MAHRTRSFGQHLRRKSINSQPICVGILADTRFETIDPALLDRADSTFIDNLPFGVIGFSDSTIVEIYSATESRNARLRPETVIGQPLFLSIAQCMNNFLVSQRFDDEPQLDAVIDYVLTYRMRPTPVRMRLIRQQDLRRRFLLIQRPTP
jgi:photoactive yellow protein